MSNFKCNECGFINIDCGKDGYKTPKEIELEFKVKGLEEEIKKSTDKNLSYEQTLDEIFKYIEETCNCCQYFQYEGCIKCDVLQIKNIIHKVKENN